MTRVFIPSVQQQAFFEWIEKGSGNAILEAVAGSGKTTTLIEGIARMRGSVAFASYNAAIAKEIKDKLEERGTDLSRVFSKTFHSYGLQAWKTAHPDLAARFNKNPKLMDTPEFRFKIHNLIDARIKDDLLPEHIPAAFRDFLLKAVTQAKNAAFGIRHSLDSLEHWRALIDRHELDVLLAGISVPPGVDLITEAVRHAVTILKASAALDETLIVFDDMLWAPLYHNVKVRQYDWVLIDESQDTNNARRILAHQMLKPGGRLVAVGDSRQAIYGFTGADADAMKLIESEFGTVALPLTVSFRCPKAVVRTARQWVTHIESHPDAIEGISTTISEQVFDQRLTQLEPTDVILCRNTKPLIQLAYRLIKARIGCRVEGREIGEELSTLASRWKATSLVVLRDRLLGFKEREIAKATAKGLDLKAQSIEDKVDSLLALIEGMPREATVSDLKLQIQRMFENTPGKEKAAPKLLTLSTIHKAKGREWDRVYWYGPNRWQPSPYAKQAWQLIQEDNLCYVACTRAKQELYQVHVAIPER